MSDEQDPHFEKPYSAFWPLLILIVGLLAWFGLHDYEFYKQQAAYTQEMEDKQFQTTVNDAGKMINRYVALINDLLQTAQKDPAAAQIVKDAMKAGFLKAHANATTNSTTTAVPPAVTK